MIDAKRTRVRGAIWERLAHEKRERHQARRIFEGSVLLRLGEDGLAQPMELRVVSRW